MTTTLWDDDGEWPKPPPAIKLCSHRMDPVVMPDGITFYASGHHSTREEGELRPDFGFYLDSVWKPDCIAWYTHWQDFGVPSLDLDTFVRMLEMIRDYARDYALEVGCIGGHGRTGTALACFAVLGGVRPEEAIEHVRNEYCHKAVETEVQEWLVEAVFAKAAGLEIPEPPPPPPPAKSYSNQPDIDWSVMGRCEKDENKGEEAKVSTDASGQEYCSMCLCDIPSADTTVCVWCGALLKSGD